MDNLNHSAEVERAQVAIELARQFMAHDPLTAFHRLGAVQQDLRASIQRSAGKDAELLRLEVYTAELVEEARVAGERWQRENEKRESQMRERGAYIMP